MKKNILFILFCSFAMGVAGQSAILKDFTVQQCDSLIKANMDNPNFVILDVRTAGEHNPQHLEGAIMRDYYAGDFEDQLDQLNKDKVYLMHCRSGGRSGNTMPILATLGFKEVYNMLGGMNAWKANSLPTTSEFSPQLSVVSIEGNYIDLNISSSATIDITITNRANDVLVVESIEGLPNDEFMSDFVGNTELLGAEDYTFHLQFSTDMNRIDTIVFNINSNGGTVPFLVFLDYTSAVKSYEIPLSSIYPNPCTDYLIIEPYKEDINTQIELYTMDGKLVFQKNVFSYEKLDFSTYNKGAYILKTSLGTSTSSQVVIKK